MSTELYQEDPNSFPITVRVKGGRAIIEQAGVGIELPIRDWGRFSDAVERFYTKGGDDERAHSASH